MDIKPSLFSKRANRFYTVGEEIANSITHGIGTVLSVIGLVILLVLAAAYNDVWRTVSFSIYGGCLVILYLASRQELHLHHQAAPGLQSPEEGREHRFRLRGGEQEEGRQDHAQAA
jgi:hypothetical protein